MKVQQLWLFSVILSVLLTEAVVAGMGLLLKGEVPPDYLLTGLVASCFVASLVVAMLGYFLEKLTESQLQLYAIVEAEPECVKLLAADGTVLQMNRAGLNMIEADSLDQLVGLHVQELVTQEYRDAFIALTKRVFEGESGILEFEILGLKGAHRWLDIHAVPLRDSHGHITALLAVTRDITERKIAENVLRESEYKFATVLDSVEAFIYIKDCKYRYLYANQPVRELFGNRLEDIIGKSDDVFFDQATTEKLYENDRRVIELGERIATEEINTDKDSGITKTYLSVKQPLRREDGTIYGLCGISTDITDRKQMDEAREEALNRLQKIASRVPGVVYQYRLRPDGSSCFPFASEAIKEIYRVSPEEVIDDASKVFAILHPDDIEGIASTIQTSELDLTPWRHEYRVKFDDGTVRWLFGNALPQRETDGSTLWHGFITDITERKQMEEKLRDSDGLNASILNSLTSHIAVLDAQGVIVAVNNAWRRFAKDNGLSESSQNMLGVNYLEVCKNAFNQPYGNEANAAQEGIAAVLAGEREIFHLEYPCHSPAQQRWFQMNVSPLQGSRRGVVISHENITERKKAEEATQAASQYARSLIEASLDPLVTISTEGKITDVNTATEQVTGVDRDSLIGSDFADYFTDPENAREVYRQVFSQDFVFDYPLAIRHVSGQVTDVLYNASAYHDGKGKVLGVFAAARDITEFKQIEAELTRSNAELEQFAYAVSHDMRQPLRMVTSYLSLIENALTGQLNEETQQFLDFAVNGAKRMDAMILSLLDYSRIGRVFEAKTRLSSKASLDEALAFLSPELSACGGEIKVTGEWPELVASRDELTRLLQNLIGNALKYHEENQPPQVHIHGAVRGGALRVEVRDHGIGIEPKQMDRLFKVFSRLQARSRFEGTGVGLALCRKIVEHHGGDIGAESAGEGQGSMFWFELSVVDAANAE
jgi:PAS domain S-box-containing protein